MGQWKKCPHPLLTTWFPGKGWIQIVQRFSALGHGIAITKIVKSKKECSRWVGEILDLASEDIQENKVHDEEQERGAEQRRD